MLKKRRWDDSPKKLTELLSVGCLSFILFVIFMLAIWAIIAVFVMVAWNLIVPTLFAGPALTYIQAYGATALISILRMLLWGKGETTK
jgi:hypothetical protein